MQRQRGFTLIELVIVVAIVAILAAIALPAYDKYVQKSRRSYAYNALTGEQTALERCYAAVFTYVGCASVPAVSVFPPAPATSYYTVTAVTAASTYALTATTLGVQVADTTCTTLTLNSTGVRTAQNSGGTDTTSSCY